MPYSFFDQWVGPFTSRRIVNNQELRHGVYGLSSLSEKTSTRKSHHYICRCYKGSTYLIQDPKCWFSQDSNPRPPAYLTTWANRLAVTLAFIFKISNLNLLSNTVFRHANLSHKLGDPVVVSLRMLPTAQANLRFEFISCEKRRPKSNKNAKQGAVRRNRNENTRFLISSPFVFPFYL